MSEPVIKSSRVLMRYVSLSGFLLSALGVVAGEMIESFWLIITACVGVMLSSCGYTASTQKWLTREEYFKQRLSQDAEGNPMCIHCGSVRTKRTEMYMSDSVEIHCASCRAPLFEETQGLGAHSQ